MAIGSNSKRIQLTFNEDKPNEAVVLEYLSKSFNEVQEIKRILFEYIVNQNDTKVVKSSRSKKEVIKDNDLKSKSPRATKRKSKVVEDIKSDKKLLTNTQLDSPRVEEDNNNSKVDKDSTSDDFILDVSSFGDELVEVKSDVINKELEEIRQNEQNELSKFM
jgi:hypothetical protein